MGGLHHPDLPVGQELEEVGVFQACALYTSLIFQSLQKKLFLLKRKELGLGGEIWDDEERHDRYHDTARTL